jgi:hypothetical protein
VRFLRLAKIRTATHGTTVASPAVVVLGGNMFEERAFVSEQPSVRGGTEGDEDRCMKRMWSAETHGARVVMTIGPPKTQCSMRYTN